MKSLNKELGARSAGLGNRARSGDAIAPSYRDRSRREIRSRCPWVGIHKTGDLTVYANPFRGVESCAGRGQGGVGHGEWKRAGGAATGGRIEDRYAVRSFLGNVRGRNRGVQLSTAHIRGRQGRAVPIHNGGMDEVRPIDHEKDAGAPFHGRILAQAGEGRRRVVHGHRDSASEGGMG